MHTHRNLNKWYARFCWIYKGLEAIYIHVCLNIPMFIALKHSVFVESWNMCIASWTTSILLSAKASGKRRKFKQKSTVNFSTTVFLTLCQRQFEGPIDCFSWNSTLGNFAIIFWHCWVLVHITGFCREELELFARLKNIQSKQQKKL
jgi:hypothetical protein